MFTTEPVLGWYGREITVDNNLRDELGSETAEQFEVALEAAVPSPWYRTMIRMSIEIACQLWYRITCKKKCCSSCCETHEDEAE